MILAGDIGATKTVLALFSSEQGVAGGAMHETRFESGKYSSLKVIIVDFLRAIAAKGRSFALCSSMPVHVILDPKAVLHGAVWYGLGALDKLASSRR